jgi:group I intron endonuclease
LNISAVRQLIIEELFNKSGIYVFVCNLNGNIYVGSAQKLTRRIFEHIKGYNSNIPLQRAFEKYGIENFTLVIVEYCDPILLIEREQFYMDLLNPNYNILRVAGSILGYEHSEEARAKIGEANQNRSEESRQSISKAITGLHEHI